MEAGFLAYSVNIRGIIYSDLIALVWFLIFLWRLNLLSYLYEEASQFLGLWLAALLSGALLFVPFNTLLPYLFQLGYGGVFYAAFVSFILRIIALYISLGFLKKDKELGREGLLILVILVGVGFTGIENWLLLSRIFPPVAGEPFFSLILARVLIYPVQVLLPAMVIFLWKVNRLNSLLYLALFLAANFVIYWHFYTGSYDAFNPLTLIALILTGLIALEHFRAFPKKS